MLLFEITAARYELDEIGYFIPLLGPLQPVKD